MNIIFIITIIIIFVLLLLAGVCQKNIIEKMGHSKESNLIHQNKINLYQTYHNKSLIPDKVYHNIQKYASNYNYIIFDDNECKNFIKKNYGNIGLSTWNSLKEPAHKADFWRYCILYKYGGLYLDIKVELIKNLDDIIIDKNIVYTVICTNSVNTNNCIFQGILYTPPNNPLFLKLIEHCIKNRTIINNYHIFTTYFSKLVKEYGKIDKLQNGLVKMKNIPDIYLFQETCTNNKNDCYDGLDRKGMCCFIYNKGEKIIKVRYSDYPWRNKYNIGIVISCFNRPEYLSKTLRSISQSNMSNTILCIIDDCSSDLNIWNMIHNFNIPSCKIIKIRNQNNLGIRYCLKKGWNLLYPICKYLCNIDSDVIVKPNWLNKLKNVEIESRIKLKSKFIIVSGFNCIKTCSHRILKKYNNFYTKKTIGGINMFFNRDTYKNIIYPVIFHGKSNSGWDWEICDESEKKHCPIVVTTPSVIQHIGVKGLNSSNNRQIIRYDIAEDF